MQNQIQKFRGILEPHEYSVVLQRAIEYHCKGLYVPPEIAADCPTHADMLNKANELLDAHKRFHNKAGCPGLPECLVCSQDQSMPGTNIYSPLCAGCGTALQPANAWMEDGCPCNSPKGVNDGSQFISHWRLLLQQSASHHLAVAQEANERLVKELVKRDDRIDQLRVALDETVNYVGRNVVCAYPDCGCDGARNCDAIRGPSNRATEQNIEGKINPAAGIEEPNQKENEDR